ncbi:hypothetical protein HYPSUDRAFT_128868 [Hypholoma sublateritium FD-334 SS-4]|uniref:AMP-dependent synthetase/ligase domain-containing protein n=1 Tax=Hypholoma sublateritium (strain FD-334 SS-4) TaxID=945553 RepID=A0A0D2Q9U6_HYPSF|nr:hypothetical protein HYPSUDRAFT_128868 [Hypholoma sublateritium FD-334 SS-4]
MQFHSSQGDLPRIPDDLTIPQFFLDAEHWHELRPAWPKGTPWVIADKSGEGRGLEELQMRTRSLAASLRDQFSIARNDVVLIFSSNHVDYPVCIWAIHRLLGIVAPFNPSSTVFELVQHLKLSKATLIISHEANMGTAYAAAREVGIPSQRVVILEDQDKTPSAKRLTRDSATVEQLIERGIEINSAISDSKLMKGEGKTQVAFYNSSSGTTGAPKIVKISHYSIIANTLQFTLMNKVGPSSPKYRAGDRSLGTTIVVVPKYSFQDMLRSIEKYRITSVMAVPPQVLMLCKDPKVKIYDLSSIRFIQCGAAPLADELYDQLTQLMPDIYIIQGYGSTETAGVVALSPLHEKHGRYGGILLPGTSAKVVKQDGALATYDEEGELYVRTPSLALGYLDNEEAYVIEYLSTYWLRTGDLVKFNRNEELIIVDRIKEMIKIRGFQVAPAELEGCLIDHPFVRDACVVGAPNTFSGEVPFAFIALTEEGMQLSQESVKQALRQHISVHKAPFKRIHHFEIINSIPKTPSGKLLRRELREKSKALMQQRNKL